MSETPLPPLPVEQKSNPEVLGFAPGLYAFQGRLLQCGNDFEVLNPLNNKLPDVTQEKLEKRNVNGIDNIVNNASTRERQEYWMGKEDNDYERQKAKWIADTVSTFASGKEYFTKSKRGQRWTKLFSKLGVDTQSFTSSHAETLYSKYFTQDKGDTNVRSFISDIVNTYKQDNGKVNYEELKQDLDAIQWITHIFGDMSSTVISQYIDAEVQLINNPKVFVEEVNRKDDSNTSRINRVDPVQEKPYLEFLYGRGKPLETTPTTPTGPEPKPETKLNIKDVILTNELSRSNPDLFKQVLIDRLIQNNPRFAKVWETLSNKGIVSLEKVKLDPDNWINSVIDGKIIVGTKPIPPEFKDKVIFEDKGMTYEDEVIYRFVHELTHQAVKYIAKSETPEQINWLYTDIVNLRTENPLMGLTALPNIEYYKSRGPEYQAREDITELMTMYIKDPQYLQRYFTFLTKPEYQQIRQRVGLYTMSEESAIHAFESIKSILDPLLNVEPIKLTPEDIDRLEKERNKIEINIQSARKNAPDKKPSPEQLIRLKEIKQALDQTEIAEPALEIKILDRPEDDKDFVIMLDQAEKSDTPIIIRTDDIPGHDVLSIDIRSSIDKLNKTNAFERRKKISDTTYMTDPVDLPGISNQNEHYRYFNIAQERDGTTYYSSCIYMTDNEGNLVPVGHVDYSKTGDKPTEASACMSVINGIIEKLPSGSSVPNAVYMIYDHFCPNGETDVAVKIDRKFKGKGLGKYLWYLTLAQAEKDKIDKINILGDATVNQNPLRPQDSFYKHLGAQSVLYIQQAYDNDQELTGGEQLYSPTYLSDPQFNHLKHLFNIN